MTTSIWITIIICITLFATMTVMLICEVIEQKYKYQNHHNEGARFTFVDQDGKQHEFAVKEGYLMYKGEIK